MTVLGRRSTVGLLSSLVTAYHSTVVSGLLITAKRWLLFTKVYVFIG